LRIERIRRFRSWTVAISAPSGNETRALVR
jgi:hypothetical protein